MVGSQKSREVCGTCGQPLQAVGEFVPGTPDGYGQQPSPSLRLGLVCKNANCPEAGAEIAPMADGQ